VAELVEAGERGPVVGTYRADDPTSYGVFELDDGVVTGIVEKPADPPSDLVNVGAYVFPPPRRGTGSTWR